ncbi:MAG: type III pantothenate kinase [Verrucomicrobiota bacterium]|nr:type III pantothenate kinase [Verrucomicrobiota bacterium]
MSLFCIDIGNTHIHFGVVATDRTAWQQSLPTHRLSEAETTLAAALKETTAQDRALEGVAFCSVVPAATEKLRDILTAQKLSRPIFQLTHEKKIGVPIGYPRPSEIGADRLANAAGAHALFDSPAIVIDLGTAVTFDIISRAGGYEGGIIAPGVEVMRRYLHEQTALLPLLDSSLDVSRAIGQSTVEAMRIGTVVGFGGMIRALLQAVLAELTARGEPPPRVLATGGDAALLEKTLRHPFTNVPDLTLRGLGAAWRLNSA